MSQTVGKVVEQHMSNLQQTLVDVYIYETGSVMFRVLDPTDRRFFVVVGRSTTLNEQRQQRERQGEPGTTMSPSIYYTSIFQGTTRFSPHDGAETIHRR